MEEEKVIIDLIKEPYRKEEIEERYKQLKKQKKLF